MENEEEKPDPEHDGCVFPGLPVPPSELSRYSINSDLHSEMEIARYVEIEAPDENIQHVERIKQEIVSRDVYEIWDVITDKGRWWVITNLTNLYSQKHFPSLDYTLSFHIGLMMRIKSRANRIDAYEPSPFDEVFRREEQAEDRHDGAVETEDFQAVGMLLRESLISLISALRRHANLPEEIEQPQDSNFNGWTETLMNHLCGGSSNKELRQHVKNTSRETWQLVNWLTHARSANKTASSIAIHSCQTTIGHLINILEKNRKDKTDQCPACRSQNMRSHFDMAIPPDGDYYTSCGVCDWNDHPGGIEG